MTLTKLRWTAGALALAAGTAHAAMVAEPVEYEVAGTKVHSVLVYDDAAKAKRPGIVMVPNWMGVTDHAVEKAKKIAGDDYVVLVADVFGADVRPADNDAALKNVRKVYADLPALRERVAAAQAQLEAHAKQASLDQSKIGAIGFCFGGAAVLEHARAGGDVDGVVAFHANIDTPMRAEPGVTKASVLVLNGADDASVTPEHIAAFEKEMKAAKVDWQFVNLSNAVHCYTEENENRPGCMYDAKAAKRAYGYMDDFFAERFGTQP